MAYDEYLAERISRVLTDQKASFIQKKMMGGMVYMLHDKMLCGTHIDKKSGTSLLMARIGEKAYEEHINKKECLPMDFTGRPMKSYIFITADGLDSDSSLERWIRLAMDFNAVLISSKKK